MNLIALLLSLSLINALPTDSNIDKRGLNLNIFSKLKPSFKRPAPIHKSESPASLSQIQSSSGQAGSRVPPSSHADDFIREPFSPSIPRDGDTILRPDNIRPSTPGSAGSWEINGGLSTKPLVQTNKGNKPSSFKPKLGTIQEGPSADAADMISAWEQSQKEYSDHLKQAISLREKSRGSKLTPDFLKTHDKTLRELAKKQKTAMDSIHPKALAEKYTEQAKNIELKAANIEKEANLRLQQTFRETTEQKPIFAAVKERYEQIQIAESLKSEAKALALKAAIAKEALLYIS